MNQDQRQMQKVYLGHKICWVCGDTVHALAKVNPELRKILAHCPEVCLGDLWTRVWAWDDASLSILGFKPQEGGGHMDTHARSSSHPEIARKILK
jgi:hypothetical protein